MEIKIFHSVNIDALRQLYLDARVSTFTWLNTQDFKLLDFDKDTEGEQIWVAVEEDEIVGFISIWSAENFIHHLYVRSENIGRGIGSALLAEAKQHFSGLSLKCQVENKSAIAFYSSKGFIIDSTVDKGLESYHLMTFDVEL